MGKAAKEHRLKVLKRNRNMQHQKNKISKEWNVAMEEQMEKLREEFAKMSADTENNLTLENTDEVETTETEQEPIESVPTN